MGFWNWDLLRELSLPMIVLISLVAALAIVLGVVLRKSRGRDEEDQLPSSDLMTKFREIHDRGGLSDEEFRTIKTKLASELKAELKDTNNTG